MFKKRLLYIKMSKLVNFLLINGSLRISIFNFIRKVRFLSEQKSNKNRTKINNCLNHLNRKCIINI